MKRIFTVLFVTLALALAPALVLAQDDQAAGSKQPVVGHHKGKAAKAESGKAVAEKGSMGARHDERVAMHKEMAEKAAGWNKSLNEKVAAMNAAQGDQKIAAMAAVINELVAQRNEMFERFKGFHEMGPGGMKHMGGGKGCPQMMEGGKGCCQMMGGEKGPMQKSPAHVPSHHPRVAPPSGAETPPAGAPPAE